RHRKAWVDQQDLLAARGRRRAHGNILALWTPKGSELFQATAMLIRASPSPNGFLSFLSDQSRQPAPESEARLREDGASGVAERARSQEFVDRRVGYLKRGNVARL